MFSFLLEGGSFLPLCMIFVVPNYFFVGSGDGMGAIAEQ
jgi:cytochrome c biogenesis protein CcdA